MLAGYQENEIYYLFRAFADKVGEVNTKELAKDYAHRMNILLENKCIGDVMSFQEFLQCVKDRSIIDYDGTGCYIDDLTGKEIKGLRCNVEWLVRNKPKNSNYVIWYNK